MRVLLASLLAFSFPFAQSAQADEPWRLQNAVPLPSWLDLSGEHRTRVEYLSDPFRAGLSTSDQILVARTRLLGRAQVSEHVSLVAEFQDSRAGRDDRQTPLNTGIVNTTDWLQAHVALDGLSLAGGRASLKLGRMTMDVGSRRFVARNGFRNTTNAFTGIDAAWQSDESTLRAFYTLPVQRRPEAIGDLRDNDARADRESLDVVFWGAFGASRLPSGDLGEIFVFGLHERDDTSRPTRNRKLYTPGFRIYRKPAKGALDYQLETAFQFGDSRSSAVSNRELDHRARFHHLELGYSFDAAWSPRLILQYDHASGDHSTVDGDNQRFDTLFGARRFDFGPTGIYGPFARANLETPGVRLTLKPRKTVSGFVSYRGFWLASDDDAWTTAGVLDATGSSGSFVGSQLETRLRWDAVPGNLRVEGGAAFLFAGEFVRNAPNSNRQGDTAYLYLQAALSF